MHTNTIDFSALYEEIYKILPAGDIQQLMDVCYRITGIPMLVVDIMYNVLGSAPQTPIGDPMWDYLTEHKTYEIDQVAQLYKEGIIQSVDTHKAPYVIDWGETTNIFPKIQRIIKLDNHVEGYVTMNCTDYVTSEDRLKAMDIIMHVCSYFFKEYMSESNLSTTYQKLFATELFNHKITTEKQLQTWFHDMNCAIDPPYIVAAIRAQNLTEKNVLSYIRKSLTIHSTNQIMLTLGNYLYILYYKIDSPQKQKHLQNHLQNTLKKFHAYCGFSTSFFSLLEIDSYITQAEDAVRFGSIFRPDGYLHDYKQYMLPAIIAPQIINMTEVNYTQKYILEIESYDKEYDSEFLNTLKVYVESGCNSTITSQTLHIHRNTLLYRLNKIEEVFQISLKDQETLLYLMLYFYIRKIKDIFLN